MEENSIPAPGSPRYKEIEEEIRQMMIELTRKADAIGWTWKLDANPVGGKQRKLVEVRQK